MYQVWSNKYHCGAYVDSFRDKVDAETYAALLTRQAWIDYRRAGKQGTCLCYEVIERLSA